MTAHVDLPADDAQLVLAAKGGCPHSLSVLVARYYPPILRYLTRHTHDREVAADLAQDTFLDVHRCLAQVEEQCFAAWLYSIARHKLHAQWRRQRTQATLSLDGDNLEDLSVPGGLALPNEDDATHERVLIGQVLAGMRCELREVLLLHCGAGVPSHEIARQRGLSDAAVRQRICRAKVAFRQQYQAMHADDWAGSAKKLAVGVGLLVAWVVEYASWVLDTGGEALASIPLL